MIYSCEARKIAKEANDDNEIWKSIEQSIRIAASRGQSQTKISVIGLKVGREVLSKLRYRYGFTCHGDSYHYSLIDDTVSFIVSWSIEGE